MMNHTPTQNYYLMSPMDPRPISSREALILFLIIIALLAAVCGSIVTP